MFLKVESSLKFPKISICYCLKFNYLSMAVMQSVKIAPFLAERLCFLSEQGLSKTCLVSLLRISNSWEPTRPVPPKDCIDICQNMLSEIYPCRETFCCMARWFFFSIQLTAIRPLFHYLLCNIHQLFFMVSVAKGTYLCPFAKFIFFYKS